MIYETKISILNAVNTLLEKKEIETISTSDICKEAHISRATFYRYFHDKYEVVNLNYMIYLDAYCKFCHSYEELFDYLFTMAKDNSFLTHAFNNNYYSFGEFICQYSLERVIQVTTANRQGAELTEIEKLQMDTFLYGVKEMYHRWIEGRYKLTSKEAAKALFEIMPESLKYYDIQTK